MRVWFITFALLISAVFASGQKVERYEIRLHDFDNLEVDNSIRVDYVADSLLAGVVRFEATPEMASRLYFSDKGKGKVDIQCCADCNNNMEFPSVTIYSSGLRRVVNSGDSLVTVNGIAPCERFEAILIGNGRLAVHGVSAERVDAHISTGHGQLTVDGNCRECKLSVTGTGTLLADMLKAVKGKATVLGTGTIGCDVIEQLTITGMGKGKVFYRSVPSMIKSHAVGVKHSPLYVEGE